MLGCLCGGFFELVALLAFASLAGVSTYVCTSLYNLKCMAKKQCNCEHQNSKRAPTTKQASAESIV